MGTSIEIRAESVGRSVLAEPGKPFSLNPFAARGPKTVQFLTLIELKIIPELTSHFAVSE